jgi:hypothetical protein
VIGLHKLVVMIFAVNFEIIQRAVGNESCYSMKNTLIMKIFFGFGLSLTRNNTTKLPGKLNDPVIDVGT